jgi:hypothetical protein
VGKDKGNAPRNLLYFGRFWLKAIFTRGRGNGLNMAFGQTVVYALTFLGCYPLPTVKEAFGQGI